MSSVQLLDKTRKIGKLLHNNNSGKVVFNDICSVLREILASNVLVISRKGKILGVGNLAGAAAAGELLEEPIRSEVGSFIDPLLNERLLSVLSTKENVNLATLGFEGADVKRFAAVVSPIEIAGERLGTLFIYRVTEEYGIDDIILCEYGSTVVGLEMLRSVSEESAEESRKLAVVKSAIGTLSYSETQAVIHIFEELGGKEGVLVASKIADRAGITRSVIVNALRKFESAGIIESRAEVLAEAIGQKARWAIYIQDYGFNMRPYSNVMLAKSTRATMDEAAEGAAPMPQLEFQKIKIEHSVMARFILGTSVFSNGSGKEK